MMLEGDMTDVEFALTSVAAMDSNPCCWFPCHFAALLARLALREAEIRKSKAKETCVSLPAQEESSIVV